MNLDEKRCLSVMDSFPISFSRSSRALAITLTDIENSGYQTLTDLSYLLAELGKVGISGPHYHNLDRDGTRIGSGAQFDVYKKPLPKTVAFKRIRLPNASNSLKTIELRAQYRTIQIEIASLCDPVRRTNPNVVRPISWGFDYSNGDKSTLIPVLAVERAICSLEAFLSSGVIDTGGCKTSSIHHHLCLDIASGLQAIHHSGLAHGDLKPSNVLIFAQQYSSVPFIAKLSDFGQCIILRKSVPAYTSYRGTPGWLPPEILNTHSDKSAIEPHLFIKCDAYTYGLLTMSVFLYHGQSLASCTGDSNQSLFAICSSRIENLGLIEELSGKLKDIAQRELASTPQSRRDISPNLLESNNDSFHDWTSSREYFRGIETSYNEPVLLQNQTHFKSRLDKETLHVLERQFEDPILRSNFNHTTLFEIALSVLSVGGFDFHARAAGYFIEAARRSHIPAQALMQRIIQAVPKFISKVSENEIKEWLFNGAKTGSIIAMEDLRKIDPFQAHRAHEEFARDGGYNDNISFVHLEKLQRLMTAQEFTSNEPLLGSSLDNAGNSPLHYAAAFGDTALLSFLLQSGADVNAVNDKGETALYKACLAGNASVVAILADFGADARIGLPDYGISCLHWLFNFEENKQLKISRLLVDMGADITCRSEGVLNVNERLGTISLPSFHFPFHWPLGTPLHWATFARRPSTCDILLNLGLNIDRLDVCRDHKNNSAYTSLSLAASYGDSLMIGHLLSRKANPGQLKHQRRGAIHSLVTKYAHLHLSPTLKWWIFHGSWESHLLELTKCVNLLSFAGADLNASAIGSASAECLTPIEEAVRDESNGGALIVLLKAGAKATCRALPQGNSLLFDWCSRLYPPGDVLSFRKGFEKTFQSICEHAGDFTGSTEDGQNVLHGISLGANVENLKFLAPRILVRAPELLEATDNSGRTPLLWAAEKCSTMDNDSDSKTRPEILLDLNANILARTSDGTGFLQVICSNRNLSGSDALKLAQIYLRAINSDIELMNSELESALRMASAALKPEVVKLLTPLVTDINSQDSSGLNSFDYALWSAHDLRLHKLNEWIERRVISRDHLTRKCYITGLQLDPEILESTNDFLRNEEAVERLFDDPSSYSSYSNQYFGVQKLEVEKYFGCVDVLKILKSVGAVKSHSFCFFGLRASLVRQNRPKQRLRYDVYKLCPKDKQEPFWVGHWEILAEDSCSCSFSDFVSVIWTLISNCWSNKNKSSLSIRDWLACAVLAFYCTLFSSLHEHETIDELFQARERDTENDLAVEISEMERYKIRWIRIVGWMKNENDIQLELGATLCDRNSKDFKSPEPPSLNIEGRGLQYTLPPSHLNWACITPSWIGQTSRPCFDERGSQLSELQMMGLKDKVVLETPKQEHDAIFEYFERFRWPQI